MRHRLGRIAFAGRQLCRAAGVAIGALSFHFAANAVYDAVTEHHPNPAKLGASGPCYDDWPDPDQRVRGVVCCRAAK